MNEPRVRILSPLFWAAMVFCLACFGGAAYVALAPVHRPAALGVHPRPR